MPDQQDHVQQIITDIPSVLLTKPLAVFGVSLFLKMIKNLKKQKQKQKSGGLLVLLPTPAGVL